MPHVFDIQWTCNVFGRFPTWFPGFYLRLRTAWRGFTFLLIFIYNYVKKHLTNALFYDINIREV